MTYNEIILNLYKKGHTIKYIANLLYKNIKKKGSNQTLNDVLNFVESTILELYTTKDAVLIDNTLSERSSDMRGVCLDKLRIC